ncbi:3-hydroxybutyryl-CoA dehydrogenase [Natronolimnobius sp. AArcel1]|uniref:3-hydroxyacyl-CoA dehydrogenase/enoyl-CoA hydratase family protein n=1 Tax=Natronolimnobius sp. AArcel1 TaxID=1679093 RepID=UPI0013EAEF34|nr:3-hydroxyacyl-CoA dehydrogenase NAD-binding domain-containing protein [Natronolimnobius sp. AArcel1]NGM70411.1 3-hydroxybutyryl-CoA dehydrogenase [Natronolimnobius sp. AArcel1]
MKVDTVQRVAVLGAGSMGHGIAEVAAIGGYDVTMRDIEEEFVQDGYDDIEWSLEKLESKGRIDESAEAVLERVDTTTDLADAVANADLVIEAVPEQLEIKEDTFSTVDEHAPDHAILASNTSSLSISDIAAVTDRPEQVVGMHFFNPPVKMDLVEVTYGEATTDETAELAYEWAESVDKRPIYVRKDVHGFVVNTVLVPFMEEAAWMLSNDETTVQETDAAMVYERGYPMGPFELNDFGGIDIAYHFRDESGQPVPPAIEEKVENDNLGRKSGKGFYDYADDGDGVDYQPEDAGNYDTLRTEAVMINKAAWLIGNDVATPEEIDIGLRLGGSFPEGMCRRGDRLGLDIVLEKLESLYDEYGAERYEPADYLVELVEEGWTGEDAGKGFFDYRVDPPTHYINWEIDDDGVLTIELDRQERMNSMSDDMFMEVDRLLKNVDDEEVSCIVFEGAGRAFSSGADITGFTADDPAEIMDVDEMFQTVYEFDRPTVAKIHGFCLGAGIELALACDIRVATEDATIGTPETNLGVIPGGGATQRLVRLIGEARTKEMVYRALQFDGEQAEEWGIVNHAVPADDLEDTVDDIVDDLVSGPPVALKAAKQVIQNGPEASLETALEMEKQAFAVLATTDDMLEGVTAFREDREPNFTGE